MDPSSRLTMKSKIAPDNQRSRPAKSPNLNSVQKCYLFLYNTTLFVFFLQVHTTLISNAYSGTITDELLSKMCELVRYLTYAQLLESIHPILKLVPGGPFMPLFQVSGRLMVNQFLTDPLLREKCYPFPQIMFIVWSSIEIFRYSHYALKVAGINFYLITWCRYTLFMPLYPMGGTSEGFIIWRTAKHLEDMGFNGSEPSSGVNFTAYIPKILRFYVIYALGPSVVFLIRYMLIQRRKQLGSKH